MNFTLAERWNSPVFSSLLENRRDGGILFSIGLLHLGFSFAGLPFWYCPILAATGIPCPGCGLTSAIFELLHGDITDSLTTHVFTPVFVLAFGMMLAAVVLPEKPRKTFLEMIRNVEKRSGLTSLLLVLLLVYWVVRLLGIIPLPAKF